MPHGTPDFGRPTTPSVGGRVIDLSEIPARRLGIVTFDRRGSVVWSDDFEGSVEQWDVDLGGTGAAVALDTQTARSPIQAMLLTAGSDGTSSASMDRDFPIPLSGLIGIEFSWQRDGELDNIDLRLIVTGTGQGGNLFIRYVEEDDLIRFWNSAGAFVTFATSLVFPPGNTLMHTWKLVIDPINIEYVRFMANHVEYDLSGISGEVLAAGASNSVNVQMVNDGSPGANETMRVDDVIYTIDEP